MSSRLDDAKFAYQTEATKLHGAFYKDHLLSLPDAKRRAFAEGDWSITGTVLHQELEVFAKRLPPRPRPAKIPL